MSLPVITIVGRPNVGKSTLFNYLTSGREAIVSDMPGVTRDRQYGTAHRFGYDFIVVDTGGVSLHEKATQEENNLMQMTKQQADQAIEEADFVLLVVDGQAGLTAADELLVQMLRRRQCDFELVVNKADRLSRLEVESDFYALGLDNLFSISAKSGRGIDDLISGLLSTSNINLAGEDIVEDAVDDAVDDAAENIADCGEDINPGIVITVMGQPNVGKSTLINTMLGEQRVMTYDAPGTTRDSIAIPFVRRGQEYTLIDTAGVRRKAKVKSAVEKFSIIKSIQAIQRADVVVYLLNASKGITDQDLQLLCKVVQSGSALVVMFNKWDLLDEEQRLEFKEQVDRRLSFVNYVRRYHLSALHGTGLGELYRAVHEAYNSLSQNFTTSHLTSLLQKAVASHQPPLVRGRRAKLRYVHIARKHPLCFMIHGKQVESLDLSYQRFIANYFRKHLSLVGVPVNLQLRNDDNPYVDS